MRRPRIWIVTALVVVVVGCEPGEVERAQTTANFDEWMRTHAPWGKATCSTQRWSGIECDVSHPRWVAVQRVRCDQEGCMVVQQ